MSLAKEIIGAIEALGGRVRCRSGRVEVAKTNGVPEHLLEALRAEDPQEVASYLSFRATTDRAAELRRQEANAASDNLELAPPPHVIGEMSLRR